MCENPLTAHEQQVVATLQGLVETGSQATNQFDQVLGRLAEERLSEIRQVEVLPELLDRTP